MTTQIQRRWLSIGFLMGVLCLLFFLRAVEQRPDSLGTLLSLQTGQELFHPHHLLFAPIIYAANQLVQPLFLMDLLTIAQLHNIFWAAMLLIGLYMMLQSFQMTLAMVMALIGCMLFSEGFWVYATQAESYIPAVSLLTLITTLVFSRPHGLSIKAAACLVVLLLALSSLYHQGFSIFFVPLAYALVAQWRGVYLWLIFASGLLSMCIYVIVYSLSITTPVGIKGFLLYLFRYATIPNPGWGTVNNLTMEGLVSLLDNQIRTFVQLPEMPWPYRKAIILGFAICAMAIAGWHIHQICRRAPFRSLRVFLLIWWGAFLGFFWWWTPYEHEFLIATQIPILLLFSLVLRDVIVRQECLSAALTGVVCSIVAIFATFNYIYEVRALATSRGEAYEEARILQENIPHPALILTSYPISRNLAFYFAQRSKPVNLALLSFIYDRPIPRDLIISPHEHIWVQAKSFEETYRIRSFTRQTHPEAWRNYIEWLFQVHHLANGIESRSFDRVTLENGASYLRISPQKITLPDLPTLMKRIDGEQATNAELPIHIPLFSRSHAQ